MDIAYIKRIGFYLILAVLALALIASLVYHAFDGLSDDLELMFLKKTDYAESFEMQAYLALSEHKISDKDYEDGMLIEYASGKSAQVSSGDIVVRLYSEESDASLVNRIYELREKIAFCEKVHEYSARQGAEQLKGQIEKHENDIMSALDLETKNELRAEYEVLLAAYAAKMDTSVNYTEMIRGYQNEIKSAYSALGKTKAEYKSDVNGAYFAECDGYEAMFSEDDIKNGKLELLYKGVTDRTASKNPGRLGKVADMNTWRLVCITDRDTSLRIAKGSKLDVTLGSSGKIYRLTVDRVVSEKGRDEAVVIFSSNLMLECDDYAHFQTVSVALSSTEGYKIPISAVRYENGISGVYVLRGSLVRYRQIEIIGSGDGYVIVATSVSSVAEGLSALNRYDRIIVRGQNLYDRKVII